MKNLLTFFLVCLLLVGCDLLNPPPKGPDNVLPPATQEGKNTFGCKVNGEIWIPNGSFSFPRLDGYYDKGIVSLRAHKDGPAQNDLEAFGMYHGKIKNGTGTYSMTSVRGEVSVSFFKGIGNEDFITDSLHTGYLTITRLDSVNSILAGTFYFDAISDQGNIIKITDGRFDLKYH